MAHFARNSPTSVPSSALLTGDGAVACRRAIADDRTRCHHGSAGAGLGIDRELLPDGLIERGVDQNLDRRTRRCTRNALWHDALKRDDADGRGIRGVAIRVRVSTVIDHRSLLLVEERRRAAPGRRPGLDRAMADPPPARCASASVAVLMTLSERRRSRLCGKRYRRQKHQHASHGAHPITASDRNAAAPGPLRARQDPAPCRRILR